MVASYIYGYQPTSGHLATCMVEQFERWNESSYFYVKLRSLNVGLRNSNFDLKNLKPGSLAQPAAILLLTTCQS